MKAFTWLGSWVALLVTGAVIIALVLRHRLPPAAAVLAVLAWAGETGAVTVTKHVVQRPRPPHAVRLVTAHGWSWPSGHTAVAALVFSVLAMIAAHLGGRRVAWVASAIAAIGIVAVGFSRIELGVHWTTDVIASVVFIACWLIVMARLFGGELQSPPRSAVSGSEEMVK
jgi:undecaprenyl-diphosphatase